MYAAHIQQAHEGCDFDFLLGTEPLPEPEIHGPSPPARVD
jgi:dihydroxy-acid dehydratase